MVESADRRNPAPVARGSRLSLLLAFVFGIVFVTALLAVVVAIPNPTPSQFEIFRIIIALAAGGVAAAIPGLLDVRLGAGAGFTLRAGGALGVFVIVYFYSPARWVTDAAVHSVNTTAGVGAGRDVNNSGGTIVIGAPPEPAAPAAGSAPQPATR